MPVRVFRSVREMDDRYVNASGDRVTGDLVVDGRLGVGVASPAEKVHVSGNVRATGSGDFGSLSIGGTQVLTSGRVLQNVSADASLITSGRFPLSRMPTSGTSNRVLVVRSANADPTYDQVRTEDILDGAVTRGKLSPFFPYANVSYVSMFYSPIHNVNAFNQHTSTLLDLTLSDYAMAYIYSDRMRHPHRVQYPSWNSGYTHEMVTDRIAADHPFVRWVSGSSTIIGSEAVDLSDYHYLYGVSLVGSTVKCYREWGVMYNMPNATPRFTVTDTTYASGRVGLQGHVRGHERGNILGVFLPTSSPSPQPVAYFEVPVVGSGSPDDPFRPAMPEEIVWDWSLDLRAKRKYDVLRKRGFSDDEIVELFPEVLCCRTNRLALTYSALIVSDTTTGRPKEYVALVRVFDQPDRQAHLHPVGRCVAELKRMRGVRELRRDEAVKAAKRMDDKLHDVDLLPLREIGGSAVSLRREYVEWREAQFGVVMDDFVASQYVEDEKGW